MSRKIWASSTPEHHWTNPETKSKCKYYQLLCRAEGVHLSSYQYLTVFPVSVSELTSPMSHIQEELHTWNNFVPFQSILVHFGPFRSMDVIYICGFHSNFLKYYLGLAPLMPVLITWNHTIVINAILEAIIITSHKTKWTLLSMSAIGEHVPATHYSSKEQRRARPLRSLREDLLLLASFLSVLFSN